MPCPEPHTLTLSRFSNKRSDSKHWGEKLSYRKNESGISHTARVMLALVKDSDHWQMFSIKGHIVDSLHFLGLQSPSH